VAFAAPRGCDAVLFELVDVLESLGLLREVRTGKTAYEVGGGDGVRIGWRCSGFVCWEESLCATCTDL
jgi:hypothetical protein